MSAAALADTLPGSKRDQIKQLLKFCSPTDTAKAVGCEVSYISQLLLEPGFADGIVAAKIQMLTKQNSRDEKYDSLEDKLLGALELKLDQGAVFMKMETVLKAIQTVNGAKRRGVQAEMSANPSNIVHLIMPTVVVKQFQTNSDNEVIQVGGQQLISMNAKQVMNELGQFQNKKHMTQILESQGYQHENAQPVEQQRAEQARCIEAATISASQI